MRETPPLLDAQRILETLDRHDVQYLVIGGIAGQAWGSSGTTVDLDVCYERTPENRARLAAALTELGARLRGPRVPPDLPFRLDAKTFELGDHFTLRTDAGDLDCLATPAGTTGYADLVREAARVELFGIPTRVASLDDLIRMKLAAGRARDRAEVEILGALRDELERRGESGLSAPKAQGAGKAGRRPPRGRRPRRPKRPKG